MEKYGQFCTINVTSDIRLETLDSGDTYTINRDLTIDLAGNTLTQNDNIEVTEGNTLTIKSDDVDALSGNGGITGAGYFNDKVHFAGGDGKNNPYKISNWYHLDNVRMFGVEDGEYYQEGTYFELVENLNQDTSGYNDLVKTDSGGLANSGKGWAPIEKFDIESDSLIPFTGIFIGNNNTINNLEINRKSEPSVGLFAFTQGGEIKDLKLNSDNIVGGNGVGSLVGYSIDTPIENISVSGNVQGSQAIGGLVGFYKESTLTIIDCEANVNVTGDLTVGGLVGSINHATIENSSASGDVSGNSTIGGLVGDNIGATIKNSFASGKVEGTYQVGGLVGYNDRSNINRSYATGNVSGDSDNIGGLVGLNNHEIKNSYATGDVEGDEKVGGLVGNIDDSLGTIENSYAICYRRNNR